MFKTIVIYLAIFSSMLLVACGGGGSTTSANEINTSGAFVRTLNIASPNITSKSYVSTAVSDTVTKITFLDRIKSFFINPAYAQNSDAELVSEDSSGAVTKLFNTQFLVQDFDLPSYDRSGAGYLVFSGSFKVNTSSGSPATCNLVVALTTGDQSTTCIYSFEPNDLPTIPVATIRDGNTDGFIDQADSVYFSVNKINGGYTLYKYDGASVKKVSTSLVGKITELKRGDRGIFGYDATLNSNTFVFGNEKRGLDVINDITDRPLFYKGFALYPFRQVDIGSSIVDQSVFFDLNRVSATTYVPEFSINCKTPLTDLYSAKHSYGVVWISSDNQRLCEAYELSGRPEPIAFRLLDSSGSWSSIKVSDNVIVGLVSVGGVVRLVIDDVAPNLNTLNQARAVDISNDLAAANLDAVTSLDYYSNGVVISGSKGSLAIKAYYNTKTKSFEEPQIVPTTIIERIEVPQEL